MTEEEIKAINDMLVAATKPLTDQVTELTKNQKILADTFTAQQAAQQSADAAAKDAKDPAATGTATKSLTADEAKKLFAEELATARKADQQTADQKASRDAFVKDPKSGLAKLPAEYAGKLGNDPTKWADEAKGIVSSFEGYLASVGLKLPDVGGANREGGNPNSGGPAKAGGFLKMAASVTPATA